MRVWSEGEVRSLAAGAKEDRVCRRGEKAAAGSEDLAQPPWVPVTLTSVLLKTTPLDGTSPRPGLLPSEGALAARSFGACGTKLDSGSLLPILADSSSHEAVTAWIPHFSHLACFAPAASGMTRWVVRSRLSASSCPPPNTETNSYNTSLSLELYCEAHRLTLSNPSSGHRMGRGVSRMLGSLGGLSPSRHRLSHRHVTLLLAGTPEGILAHHAGNTTWSPRPSFGGAAPLGRPPSQEPPPLSTISLARSASSSDRECCQNLLPPSTPLRSLLVP